MVTAWNCMKSQWPCSAQRKAFGLQYQTTSEQDRPTREGDWEWTQSIQLGFRASHGDSSPTPTPVWIPRSSKSTLIFFHGVSIQAYHNHACTRSYRIACYHAHTTLGAHIRRRLSMDLISWHIALSTPLVQWNFVSRSFASSCVLMEMNWRHSTYIASFVVVFFSPLIHSDSNGAKSQGLAGGSRVRSKCFQRCTAWATFHFQVVHQSDGRSSMLATIPQ